MTFNPNVPQTGTRIDQTYNIVQNNFLTSNQIFGNDHYQFDDASVPSRGLHKKVTFVKQGSAPSAVANTGIMYAVNNINSGSIAVTRVDPYYKYDTGTLGNGLTAPVIPYKCFGTFNVQMVDTPTLGPSQVSQLYNVGNIAQTSTFGGVTSCTITVTFANQVADGSAGTAFNYPVFLTSTLISDSYAGKIFLWYRSRTKGGFSILIKSTSSTAFIEGMNVTFGVLTL